MELQAVSERDDLNALAYRDCIMWAIGQQSIRDLFTVDTGMAWVEPSSSLDRMIDAATGHERQFVEVFIPWFNENVWGADAVPAGVFGE